MQILMLPFLEPLREERGVEFQCLVRMVEEKAVVSQRQKKIIVSLQLQLHG